MLNCDRFPVIDNVKREEGLMMWRPFLVFLGGALSLAEIFVFSFFLSFFFPVCLGALSLLLEIFDAEVMIYG